jgi:hypothetical protein
VSFVNTPIPGVGDGKIAPTDPSIPGLVGARQPFIPMINGIQNVLVWAAPNDGRIHWVVAQACITTIAAMTGGQVQVMGTANGAQYTSTLLAGGFGAGTASNGIIGCAVDPGTTLTIRQTTALTAGGPAMVGANINETTYGG